LSTIGYTTRYDEPPDLRPAPVHSLVSGGVRLRFAALASCSIRPALLRLLASCAVCVATLPSHAASTDGAVSGGDYRLFVTNESSGDLTVIDARDHRVIATLPLGKRPRGIRASADGSLLFVALSGSPLSPPGVDPATLPPADKAADGIGVIAVSTLSLTKVLRGFSDPEQLAVSRDGTRLYVASEDTGVAVIADARNGKMRATLAVGGEPEGVSLSNDDRYAYVTSEEDHQVAVIDTRSEKLATTFRVGQRPRDIAFSRDGQRAYVSNETDGTVTVVDAVKHQPLRTVKVPGQIARPMGVVVSPDGKVAYTATGRGGTVVAIDTTTFTTRSSEHIGQRPWGIALSPDGRLLYTANGPSNDVSVIDAKSLKLLKKISAGQRPWGVVVVPNSPH
jgi:YVTN family beta-propeller protein